MASVRALSLALLVAAIGAGACQFEPPLSGPAVGDGAVGEDPIQTPPGSSPAPADLDGGIIIRPGPDAGDTKPGLDGGSIETDEEFRLVPHLINAGAEVFGGGPRVLDGVVVDTESLTLGDEADPDNFRVFVQDQGGEVAVLSVDSLRVLETVRVVGTRPLVIVALGNVEIEGLLDGGGRGRTPGPGGSFPGLGPGRGGEGNRGDGADVGGGGAGGWTPGADGGAGGGLLGTPGAAGASYLESSLPILLGGSGGGRGTRSNCSPNAMSGYGGAGGGAIQIFSRKRIRISGGINVGGGGGEGGLGCPANTLQRGGAGSGGGSGGVIDLAAPRIGLMAGGFLAANGGGGGSGANAGQSGVPGGDGSGGAEPAVGGGMLGELGLAGGAGGAMVAPPTAGAGGVLAGTNGGGGGGAVGIVRVDTKDDSFESSGVISPPL